MSEVPMSLTSSSHILVVDDDRALRHAVSSLLERNGHTVLQAGDGPAALAHLARTDVQLMLLDMGLPGMTGLDLLARVRAGDRHPIVVVITADDTPETLLAAIRAQAYRYVKKPVSPAAIVEVVEETLQASNAAGEDPRARIADDEDEGERDSSRDEQPALHELHVAEGTVERSREEQHAPVAPERDCNLRESGTAPPRSPAPRRYEERRPLSYGVIENVGGALTATRVFADAECRGRRREGAK